MLKVTMIELNDEGRVIAMKGTYKRSLIFSKITDKTIFWADYGIEYIGG